MAAPPVGSEVSVRLQSRYTVIVLGIVLGSTALGGCSLESTPPDPPQRQTTILSAGADPNPVAVGDSTTFTVVIADSLDPSFEFTWDVTGQPLVYADSPSVTWAAPSSPGAYHVRVTADNGDGLENTPNSGFTLTVVPRP